MIEIKAINVTNDNNVNNDNNDNNDNNITNDNNVTNDNNDIKSVTPLHRYSVTVQNNRTHPKKKSHLSSLLFPPRLTCYVMTIQNKANQYVRL